MFYDMVNVDTSLSFLPIIVIALTLRYQCQRDWFAVWLKGFTNFHGIGLWFGFLLPRLYNGCRVFQ
jgi:hypothetical protein